MYQNNWKNSFNWSDNLRSGSAYSKTKKKKLIFKLKDNTHIDSRINTRKKDTDMK